MRVSRFFLLAALAGALSACAQQRLPPGGVATLDGFYEGEVSRSTGPLYGCPAAYKLRITVKAGEARGEILDLEQQDAVVDRILAFIEADGRVITSFRSRGETYSIEGSFGASAFQARSNGRICSYSAFARRKQ